MKSIANAAVFTGRPLHGFPAQEDLNKAADKDPYFQKITNERKHYLLKYVKFTNWKQLVTYLAIYFYIKILKSCFFVYEF